jgi:hypothetical protein
MQFGAGLARGQYGAPAARATSTVRQEVFTPVTNVTQIVNGESNHAQRLHIRARRDVEDFISALDTGTSNAPQFAAGFELSRISQGDHQGAPVDLMHPNNGQLEANPGLQFNHPARKCRSRACGSEELILDHSTVGVESKWRQVLMIKNVEHVHSNL